MIVIEGYVIKELLYYMINYLYMNVVEVEHKTDA